VGCCIVAAMIIANVLMYVRRVKAFLSFAQPGTLRVGRKRRQTVLAAPPFILSKSPEATSSGEEDATGPIRKNTTMKVGHEQ
jgi:hypothetical protein